MEFKKYGKTPRLIREIVITEKLDGTNSQIIIGPNGEFACGSRNRIITPDNDNFGFATWAYENKDELMKLGEGNHYGEWWGLGIQRGYGLSEKRFSLFNAGRWGDMYKAFSEGHDVPAFPACCHVVPVVMETVFDTSDIRNALHGLQITGSLAAPGYMNPEGIIVYHTQSKQTYKMTFEYDSTGKPE